MIKNLVFVADENGRMIKAYNFETLNEEMLEKMINV
jgi:hypothetical protein